jgi:hypothetical protein
MWVYPIGTLLNPRYIINFPTKDSWRMDSSLGYIEDGLQDLIYVLATLNIRSIAIPALGCNNGGLKWCVVKDLIKDRLIPISDRVEIRLYEPRY